MEYLHTYSMLYVVLTADEIIWLIIAALPCMYRRAWDGAMQHVPETE
jgi:hypothetical protein